jgi:hypothetical protein
VGGYAVALHGYIRATGDIDIWFNATNENAQKILKVMLLYGFPKEQFSLNDFNHTDSVIIFGSFDAEINLLGYLDGVNNFNEAYQQRKRMKVDGNEYNFLSLSDLIKNKQTVGRAKDLEDIEKLNEIQSKKSK